MDKLKMQTENIVDENIDFIGKKFPNCIVEAKDESGKLTKMVDFDLLKQELSKVVVDGDKERYTMNWPDKKQAILTANSPIAMTLRPCKEKSVDFDNTKNIYIEGDNLDVLKVLRETYLGKIKMIYIDPPYNTGNDFVYNDDFATNTEDYLTRSNQIDVEGNRMVSNNESNGRFHTDWLNMIYPRLKVAKDLLTDDGIIFISIDDNEQENLKKVCAEIFGEGNFVATLKWKKKKQPSFLSKVADVIEYIVVYAKNYNQIGQLCVETISDSDKPVVNASNNMVERIIRKGIRVKAEGIDKIEKGICQNKTMSVEYLDDVYIENGRTTNDFRCIAKFRTNQGNIDDFCKQDLLFITKNLGFRRDLTEDEKSGGKAITDLLLDWGQNQDGTNELKDLFELKNDYNIFTNPKPTLLIKNLLKTSLKEDDMVLDFFSGSATTAHALMKLNAEDNGNRKFIMVQLPEICDENSEAYKAGYKNICEIGEERIRRAGKRLELEIQNSTRLFGKDKKPLENNVFDKNALQMALDKIDEPANDFQNLADKKLPDIGFRVFKLDSSNMKDTYYKPADYSLNLLDQLDENIKPDRTPEDLLFQVMLDLGLMLDSKIEEKNINGKKVFVVGEYNDYVSPDLICCFDSNVDNNTVTEIAKMKPRFSVFRDSSMSRDSVAVNFDQIFETYSPSTTRKVL